MGITNLLPFLKPIAKNTHISKYKNEVIGVDIMCWIHRGLISCAYDVVTDNYNDSYLSFIEKMLECINHYNIKVVFVFDGEELPEKKAENLIRKDRREKAKKEAQEIIKSVANPRSDERVLKKCIQAISVSKDIINTVIHFCKKKNIDYIISPFEADAQLSYLCRMGYISCAISEDSDLLVYGCPRVLYKLKSTGECDEISLMPIDDLIDVNVINKIRNPLSDSFNEFYITPMKESRKDAEGGYSGGEEHNVSDWEQNNASDWEQNNVSDWEQNNVSDWEKNNVSDLAERPPTRSQRRTRHRAAAKRIPEQKKKSYRKVMKEYLDHFYWPEELDKLKHFSIDMFLAMCILSGCDYTNDFHITGMGIKTAFSLISQYKTIENIFSFLISHDRWKRKIPPNLNTLEKLLSKYEEIKNAFLHHQVYDFILCQNIPINQSFNSALKKNENKLLINKIRDFSLIYDNSKRRGNCLNVYSEDLSSGASEGGSNLLPHGSGSSERCTERSTRGEEKVDIAKQHYPKDMLKGNASPESPSKRSPVPPKQTAIKEHPYLDKPNNFENIFKNLTSECLEYLEISPELFRNCHEGQNDLKKQKGTRHEGAGGHPLGRDYVESAQEGSHGSSGWISGWQSGKENYVACHPGEYRPNVIAKQESPKGDTQTRSPLYPRGTIQTANLWSPMQCTKLSKIGDSPRSNSCAYGREYTNDEDEEGVLRNQNDSKDTVQPSEPPAYNSRNDLPRGKEKTKLSKRKGNHVDSVNFKKTKRSVASSPHTGDQTWSNLLDEKEPDCSKRSGQNHPGEILENTKWISQSGDNCQGVARLKRCTAHGIDTNIQEDATKGNPQKQQKEEEAEGEEGEVTNQTGGMNRKKSARVMYQNMKSSFLLFKTLDGETNNQMGSSTTELKRNSTQEKVECAHVREIQGRSKAERPDEEGGSSVETDIWDRKDEMRSDAQGKTISKPIAEQTSDVKNEIYQTYFKSERSDHPSDVFSPCKSKSSAVNENRRNQLRITNFFKKSERKIPNLEGNKGGNNNTFPLSQPTNGSPSGNGKYSLSINNSESANKEQRRINSPNELGIYERRMDGIMTKYRHRFSLQRNTEQQGVELPYGGQEVHDQDAHETDIHEKDAPKTDTHDEYVFLKNLHNCGLIKDPNRKESPKWVVKGGQTWDDGVSRGDRADQGEVRQSDHHNDHPNGHHSDHHNDHPNGHHSDHQNDRPNDHHSDHHNDRPNDHSMDHPYDHHDRPVLGDAPHADRPAEKKEKQKEINLEYILQNLNYNYHPRSHKINTFDYFKEKENLPPPNPYQTYQNCIFKNATLNAK
ncbi:exonuclease I [Plasmodium cynomolgi strain B]|uniref:Exonuclease 1 n=1 Tax=Plasmodium cynomolgi (strain B) TaxID=1120755 RepID=K6V6Y4_PLACD|nr:exonuclease I [Plasmodium cynomolgi strain B]GAB64877.1 exonuclease I [Plasmodium cynomolgi strain B]